MNLAEWKTRCRAALMQHGLDRGVSINRQVAAEEQADLLCRRHVANPERGLK